MGKEVKITLTDEQIAKIKQATGRDLPEVTVGSMGNNPALSVKSPSVKSPSVKSPSVKSPSVKSPSVKSPSVKSPSVKSPSVKSPSVKGQP